MLQLWRGQMKFACVAMAILALLPSLVRATRFTSTVPAFVATALRINYIGDLLGALLRPSYANLHPGHFVFLYVLFRFY